MLDVSLFRYIMIYIEREQRKVSKMKPSIEQIKQVAETFKGEYGIVAIRTQEESFELGSIDHVSHVWDDGDDTGIEIDGISATMVSAPEVSMHGSDHGHAYYFGENVAIICGDSYEYGEDAGEVVISDPVCVHIF